MPFTVTTTDRQGIAGNSKARRITSRIAVATPDEVRDLVSKAVTNICNADEHEAAMIDFEAGNKMSLPDDIEIEVHEVTWGLIYQAIGWDDRYHEWEPEWDDHPEAITKFNSNQGGQH